MDWLTDGWVGGWLDSRSRFFCTCRSVWNMKRLKRERATRVFKYFLFFLRSGIEGQGDRREYKVKLKACFMGNVLKDSGGFLSGRGPV